MYRLAAVSVLVFVAACSSSGSASFSLTDAPTDLTGVTAVNITISSIQAHVAGKDELKDGDPADSSIDDDGKWVTLTPATKAFDLLTLINGYSTPLGDLDLPVGKITQIRIFLDTSKPGNNSVSLGTQVCNLDTSKVNAKGIKISHPFKALAVNSGGKVETTVDFIASDSIIKQGDCLYQLTPVIKLKKVKVDGQDFSF
jgi:hypothetical protein